MSEPAARLGQLLPGARLTVQEIPMARPMRLALLQSDFTQAGLPPAVTRQVMDEPPFWVFCWPSGHLLAHLIAANPQLVRGRTVLDFGCGAGVVAVAAALQGARALACDLDPVALAATAHNAALNQVEVELFKDYENIQGPIDVVFLADVLYDHTNLPWLARLAARAEGVAVADSRFHGDPGHGLRSLGTRPVRAVPDFDLHDEFGLVSLFARGLPEEGLTLRA